VGSLIRVKTECCSIQNSPYAECQNTCRVISKFWALGYVSKLSASQSRIAPTLKGSWICFRVQLDPELPQRYLKATTPAAFYLNVSSLIRVKKSTARSRIAPTLNVTTLAAYHLNYGLSDTFQTESYSIQNSPDANGHNTCCVNLNFGLSDTFQN
jgi:hypothetical protein